MTLTKLEYDAIMQAINEYKAELETNGVNPFMVDDEKYSRDSLLQALDSVENKIINECLLNI